jgi:hypothetical protein
MCQLTDMAFLFCSRAKEKGLKKYDIICLVETQLDRVESLKAHERPVFPLDHFLAQLLCLVNYAEQQKLSCLKH